MVTEEMMTSKAPSLIPTSNWFVGTYTLIVGKNLNIFCLDLIRYFESSWASCLTWWWLWWCCWGQRSFGQLTFWSLRLPRLTFFSRWWSIRCSSPQASVLMHLFFSLLQVKDWLRKSCPWKWKKTGYDTFKLWHFLVQNSQQSHRNQHDFFESSGWLMKWWCVHVGGLFFPHLTIWTISQENP